MKIKPKEILINIPIVLLFDDYHQITEFASTVNQIIHGKIKIKYEELGLLGSKYVGLFYIQRNDEFHELRNQFKNVIEKEEVENYKSELK